MQYYIVGSQTKVVCRFLKNKGVDKMDINGFGKAEKEKVESFEQHIGLSLPEDYRKFLLECNGGMPHVLYSTFRIEALNQIIPLDVLYGLDTGNELELMVWNEEYSDDLLPNSIIIGRDPGSGMIVLINDSENKGIYYWDHSLYFEESSEDENLYKIADTFQAFISGLKYP